MREVSSLYIWRGEGKPVMPTKETHSIDSGAAT
jgi:hypothetical protein